MLTPQQAAAYHEAGHAYIASITQGAHVGDVSIYQEEHGWGGDTDITFPLDAPASRAMIALAGIVAEAKAQALCVKEKGCVYLEKDDRKKLVDYLTNAKKLVSAGKKAEQIDFWIKDAGQQVHTSISVNDAVKVHESYREGAPALAKDLAQRLQEDDEWKHIKRFAEELIKAPKNRLTVLKVRELLPTWKPASWF